ncbi:MAG: hypothetical protein ACPKQO_11945 [Nitrososphaeraceae archaeon]
MKSSTTKFLSFSLLSVLTFLLVFININNIFAVEYTNYTSEKYGIQFEYPSNWTIDEKTSRFDSGPDMMIADYSENRNINFIFSGKGQVGDAVTTLLETFGLKKVTEILLESFTDDFGNEYKTIESPSITSINGKETGTFLFTEKDKYEDFATKYAKQMWITDVDSALYNFAFVSPTSTFDSQENIEIRDHFINSIKFLDKDSAGDDSDSEEQKESTSRFD